MKRGSLLLTVLLLLLYHISLAQSDSAHLTKQQTDDWFYKKEWLGSLPLQPHESVDKVTFARQYAINKVYWDKAFSFLKDQDLQTLPAGRYAIAGDTVYAIITQNLTKDYDSTKWESHRHYTDLHCVISGEEKIAVAPISRLAVTMPYDSAKDVINYSGEGDFYLAGPGTFFLFFPQDGHRPNVTPGGNKLDKKVVIKIRYAE